MQFQQFDSKKELIGNAMGLQEPVHGRPISVELLDLVLVPLVAFDKERNRIGMGGGYYDRTFEFLGNDNGTRKPAFAGLAFDCQNVEEITPNPWDIRLLRVFTESTAV